MNVIILGMCMFASLFLGNWLADNGTVNDCLNKGTAQMMTGPRIKCTVVGVPA